MTILPGLGSNSCKSSGIPGQNMLLVTMLFVQMITDDKKITRINMLIMMMMVIIDDDNFGGRGISAHIYCFYLQNQHRDKSVRHIRMILLGYLNHSRTKIFCKI